MIVVFILCICGALLGIMKYKNFYNPLFLFSIVWALITGLYSFDLQEMIRASQNTKLVIFLGILFFVGGVLLADLLPRRRVKGCKETSKTQINDKVFEIFSLIVIALLAVYCLKSFQYLLRGASLADIRYRLRGEIIGFNAVYEILYVYFVTPACYVIIHACTINYFKKYKRMYMIGLTVLIVAMSLLSEGGRFMMMYVAVDYLLVYLISKSKVFCRCTPQKMKSSSANFKYLMVFVLAFVAIYIVTYMRGVNVFASLYKYICGCISFFELKLEAFETSFVHTYGYTSLNGFIRPVVVVLEKLGMENVVPHLFEVSEKILLDVEKASYISETIIYNGFVTMFYAFYADFSLWGVMGGALIWGYVCQKCYLKYKKSRTDRSMMIYLLIVQAIFTSMLKFQFVSYMYALAFIYQMFIYKSEKEV